MLLRIEVIHSQNIDSLIANYQYSAAKVELEKDMTLLDSNTNLLNKYALCQKQLGETSLSITSYEKSLMIDSLQINPRIQLSRLYQAQGQLTKAINVYSKVISLDSNNTYFLKKYAGLLRQAYLPLIAAGIYQKAIEINPKDEESKIDLIKSYQEANMMKKANDLCDSLLAIHADNYRFHYESAKLSYSLKNYEKTIKALESSTALKGDSNLIEIKLLAVSFFHLKRYEKAIPLLEDVINNTDKNEVMFYYLGLCYKNVGQLDLAEENLDKAIDEGTSENLGSYYTNLAIIHENNGNHYEAIKAFQKAYKLSESAILLYHLARNYDMYYRDKGTAMRYYERFIQANDSTQEVFTNYSKYRLTELKQIMHFKLDSLN